MKYKSPKLTHPKDALFADQLDQFVLDRTNCIALSIGSDVTQVTNVTVSIGRSAMRLRERID